MGELGGTLSHAKGKLLFIHPDAAKAVVEAAPDTLAQTKVFADIARVNALSMIMETGSGHPGSSLSAMDIVAWLWRNELRHPNSSESVSDIYFSSKGHDAPGLYAVWVGLGRLAFDRMHQFRRLGGLPGHPDISLEGIATNTGSLGMGISKAKGMALARRLNKKQGRIYVLTGDGELQEGQFWESLQPTANLGLSEITVIVDHNKIQSDKPVTETSNLGDLEKKIADFGWAVRRIDGHDMGAIKDAIAWAKTITDRPQAIIADTVKGKGVSFMEKFDEETGFYKFHSGAPTTEHYAAALKEIFDRITSSGETLEVVEVSMPERKPPTNAERLVNAYSDELVKLGKEYKNLVAMDADLILDTGLIPFSKTFPERYIEAGIAEQDMVSMAGGMALQGVLPIVHSFACFMPTRANEQIYNNASEKTKIIYVASLAGLLPATPGHSHQSVRDISIVGSVPGLTLIEPSCERETRLAIRYAVEENKDSTYIRLVSIPVDLPYTLPESYTLEHGKGVVFKEGTEVELFAYGPAMLSEAYKAAVLLEQEGVSAKVVNLPWLNAVDEKWLAETIFGAKLVVAIDDHYTQLGQGVMIGEVLARIPDAPAFLSLGVRDIPECGAAAEVLAHHQLDAASLAISITESLSAL